MLSLRSALHVCRLVHVSASRIRSCIVCSVWQHGGDWRGGTIEAVKQCEPTFSRRGKMV